MVAHQQQHQRGRSDQQSTGAMQSMSQYAGEAMSRPKEMVEEYPISSMLLVFGVGMGLGVVLSQALIPSFHETTMTERMGRQLYDSMCNLTSAVQRGIKSYT
jgi:hypothetical protein